MTPHCRHNLYVCEICDAEALAYAQKPFEPWTQRPRFVTELDPQATERLVNLFVDELCNVIEENASKLKSEARSKKRSRTAGEYDALVAVIHRMQEHGLIRRNA